MRRPWCRRVGDAVDLVESGYTIEQVMRKGDWKSAQAGLRYVMAEWLLGIKYLAVGIWINEFRFERPV